MRATKLLFVLSLSSLVLCLVADPVQAFGRRGNRGGGGSAAYSGGGCHGGGYSRGGCHGGYASAGYGGGCHGGGYHSGGCSGGGYHSGGYGSSMYSPYGYAQGSTMYNPSGRYVQGGTVYYPSAGVPLTMPLPTGGIHHAGGIQPSDATTRPVATVKVSITDGAFEPKTMSVKPGTRVVWTNDGKKPHTVTSDKQDWASSELAPGQTYSATFTKAGTFDYHCALHASMKGTVNVK